MNQSLLQQQVKGTRDRNILIYELFKEGVDVKQLSARFKVLRPLSLVRIYKIIQRERDNDIYRLYLEKVSPEEISRRFKVRKHSGDGVLIPLSLARIEAIIKRKLANSKEEVTDVAGVDRTRGLKPV